MCMVLESVIIIMNAAAADDDEEVVSKEVRKRLPVLKYINRRKL